jgi:hypothetical protein
LNWQIYSSELHGEIKVTKINKEVVKQIALGCTWSYWLWMFCLLDIKGEIIGKEQQYSIATDHSINITE